MAILVTPNTLFIISKRYSRFRLCTLYRVMQTKQITIAISREDRHAELSMFKCSESCVIDCCSLICHFYIFIVTLNRKIVFGPSNINLFRYFYNKTNRFSTVSAVCLLYIYQVGVGI